MECCKNCLSSVIIHVVLYTWLASRVFCEQQIIEHPLDKSIIRGSTVILKCQVSGMVGPLQWTKDGFGLGSDRDLSGYTRYRMVGDENSGYYNLEVTDVQLEDDAKYQCQIGATETERGIRSDLAKLTVWLPPDPPVIQDAPVVEVVANEPYNLSCTAINGKPAPKFTWLMGGSDASGEYIYSVTTQSDGKKQDAEGCLTYSATKADHGKSLECQVINEALSTPLTVMATLEVLYAAEITMSVEPLSGLREFDTVKIRCDATANPPEVTWKWYRNDNVIPGAEASYFEIQNIGRDYNTNAISCEATNKVKSSRQSYALNIEYGPKYKKVPEDIATDLGATATMHCDIDGNPAPMIVWRKKYSSLILSSSSTLSIEGVEDGDIGTYECQATVSGFAPVQAEVNLFLRGPPRIASDTTAQSLQGVDAEINCTALSIPRPETMVWYRNGEVIIFSDHDRFDVEERDTASGRRSTMKITDVHSNDYGLYNCTVANSYGSDSMVIEFIQIDAVPMAYVIGGVLGGVALMIIIAIAIFCYHRRKKQQDKGESDTSSDIDKKPQSEVRMEYIGREGPLEPWRTDYNRDHDRYSAEYDELKYPETRPPNGHGPPPHDYPDSYNYNPGYSDDYNHGVNGGPPAGYDNSVYGSQYPTARSDRSHGPSPQAPNGYPVQNGGYGPGPQIPAYQDGIDDSYSQGPQVSRLSTNV